MLPVRSAAPVGWLAVLGLALLASSALLRRDGPASGARPDADDLLARIYA